MGGTVTITSFLQSPNVLFTFRVLVQKRDATKKKNLPFMQMRGDLGARPSEGFVLIEVKGTENSNGPKTKRRFYHQRTTLLA